MTTAEKYMLRCLELAKNGLGNVSPNPMVGAIIVHDDKIIGEGFHIKYGEAHAETNAINDVETRRATSLLKESTLYVNLEPCSHFGKTPPCAKLIIEKEIPRVVIGNVDPSEKVAGKGIEMLREAGVEVITNVLDKECRELNKRFFCVHEKRRPYIILKWAQSEDGFIDGVRVDNTTPPVRFSNELTTTLAHKMRAEEDAVLIGTNTALKDNPQLTLRHWAGKNPTRVVIDRHGKIPHDYHLFDDSAPTLIFTQQLKKDSENITYIKTDFSMNILPHLLSELLSRRINSVIVEGGALLLSAFINSNLWDEAQVEIAPFSLHNGIKAPFILQQPQSITQYEKNKIVRYYNLKL